MTMYESHIAWLFVILFFLVKCHFVFPNQVFANSSYDSIDGLYGDDSVVVAYQSTFSNPTLI